MTSPRNRLQLGASATSARTGQHPRPQPSYQPEPRIKLGLAAAGTVAAILLAIIVGASGCGTSADSDILPTTRPVLTTMRPELTTTTTAPIVQRRVYVVQPGDTLLKIATGFDVSVQDLMSENGKESTVLRIGEQLIIPPTAGRAAE